MPRSSRASASRPSQRQLVLPLLDAIASAGGAARPKEVADVLAAQFALPTEERDRRVLTHRGSGVNAWDRDVRWARQRAVHLGLVAAPERNLWAITEAGRDGLRSAVPGVVVTVYVTDRGAALWARCESAVSLITPASVNLILTSPPYLLGRQKAYGNEVGSAYLDWLTERAAEWKPLLAADGSLVLNLGETWNPGEPSQSIYLEEIVVRLVRELGFTLNQRTYWQNPAKLPSPAPWVCQSRERLTPSVEPCYIFGTQARVKANNRNVLRPYGEKQIALMARGGEAAATRPSGHTMSANGFATDNGGAIAHSLFVTPNTSSNDVYTRECKARGLPVHPARFPAALAEFYVKFLTDEDDLVFDPFAGSGTVAQVCEQLKRRWLATEQSLTYLAGSSIKLASAPGFRDHLGFPGATA